jgi:hypothetical protein
MTPDSSLPFPGLDPLAPLRAAEAAAERLLGVLRITRTLAEARRAVDIAGFDGLVGRLCAQSLDLPPEDGRKLRPRLIALLDELSRLERALTAPD